MPKVGKSSKERLNSFVKTYGAHVLSSDGKVLLCFTNQYFHLIVERSHWKTSTCLDN